MRLGKNTNIFISYVKYRENACILKRDINLDTINKFVKICAMISLHRERKYTDGEI